nr:hypothetical protein [Actinomyces sp.]
MTYAMLNAEQILQFGSDDDSVALAPVGTELPTSLTNVNAAFKEVGWLNEDGMGFTPSDSVDKRKGHQGHRVYRTVMTDSSTDFKFTALQSNYQTLALQWNVKEVKTADGVTTARLSNARDVDAFAIVIRAYANGHSYLWACSRFEVGERDEMTLSATDDTAYAITGTFAADVVFITDDPAYKQESGS